MTQNRRRNSRQSTKVVIRSSDDVIKILPGVLLTYDEKFTKITCKEDRCITLNKQSEEKLESEA